MNEGVVTCDELNGALMFQRDESRALHLARTVDLIVRFTVLAD
jgi:hypothetical protein